MNLLSTLRAATPAAYRFFYFGKHFLMSVVAYFITCILAHAQVGTGWVQYSPVKKIHLDNEAGLQTFNWTNYKSVCDPVCADYSYDGTTNTETFRLFDNRTNRSEIRLQNEYSTGSRQFEGYVTFYAPLDDESLMQVFGSTSGATQLMIRGYAANGGSIRGGGQTLATNVYGTEVKVNVIHLQEDVGNKIIIYINDVKMAEVADNEAVTNYHKYGNYGTLRTDEAIVKWRATKFFRDGYAPGTTAPPSSNNPFDITNNGGTITAQYSNTSKPSENYPSLIDNSSATKYYQSGRKALWVQYRSAIPAIVTRYTITSANDVPERDPKDWNLAGSNDGATWITLDTRANETFSSRFLKKTYSCENTTAYTYYRLTITNNNGHTGTQFAEWELLQRKTQAISFTTIPGQVYGTGPVELIASSDSELPITWQVVSGPAVVNNDLLEINGAGTVTIRAIQEGNENYFPAFAEQTFTVHKAPQTISFEAITPKSSNESVTLTANSSSSLPVTFTVVGGPGSINGNILSFTGQGNVTVRATQPGNENYLAADAVEQTILVYKDDDKKDGIKVKVFPNPTNGPIKVKLENKKDKDYTFVIYNSQGMPVTSTIVPKSHKVFEINFDLSNSPDGHYYLWVSDGTEEFVRLIILKE